MQTDENTPLKKKRNPLVTFLAALGLIALVCVIVLFLIGRSAYKSSPRAVQPTVSVSDEYQLELLSSSLTSASEGYLRTEGQVKNITGQSLENIEAVVQLFDANDEFITSDSAIIDFNPILPGQTSPFQVTTPKNPKIERYSISFKILLGGTIPTKDSRK